MMPRKGKRLTHLTISLGESHENLGKAVAAFCGLAVLAVALLAVLFWTDLLVEYHLFELRRNPSYLLQLADAVEGTPENEAVERFLKSRDGKEAIVEAFLVATEEVLKEHRTADGKPLFSETERAVLCMIDGSLSFQITSQVFNGTGAENSRLEELSKLNQWLKRLNGEEFDLRRRSGRKCSVLPMSEVSKKTGFAIMKSPARGSGDKKELQRLWGARFGPGINLVFAQDEIAILIERI